MNHPEEPSGTTEHPTEPTPRSSGSARRRRPARKNTRDSFGSVRRLPSGRYQVRFSDAGGARHTAPDTFATRREAVDYLAVIRAEMFRGTWRAPELGAVTVADYAASLLAVRVDLAPKTRQLYEELQRLWIDAPHELPAAGRQPRTINLGQMELGSLTVATIRDWYAAAIHTTDQRAAKRAEEAEQRALRKRTNLSAARSWALDRGLRVGASGRLPAAVLQAWKDAGSPVPDTSAVVAPVAPRGYRHGPTRRAEPASPRPTAT